MFCILVHFSHFCWGWLTWRTEVRFVKSRLAPEERFSTWYRFWFSLSSSINCHGLSRSPFKKFAEKVIFGNTWWILHFSLGKNSLVTVLWRPVELEQYWLLLILTCVWIWDVKFPVQTDLSWVTLNFWIRSHKIAQRGEPTMQHFSVKLSNLQFICWTKTALLLKLDEAHPDQQQIRPAWSDPGRINGNFVLALNMCCSFAGFCILWCPPDYFFLINV